MSTKEGTEVKCVAKSSSITGQSERDLDFSVMNKSQQIKEQIQSEGMKVKSRTLYLILQRRDAGPQQRKIAS